MYIIKTGISPCKTGTFLFASIRQVHLHIHQSDRYTFSMYIIKTGITPCKQVHLHLHQSDRYTSIYIRQVQLHLHQSDRYASIYISQTGTAPFASIRQVHLLLQQSDRYTAIYVSQTGTSAYVLIRQVHLCIRKKSQKGSHDLKLIWHIKSAKGSELRSCVKERAAVLGSPPLIVCTDSGRKETFEDVSFILIGHVESAVRLILSLKSASDHVALAGKLHHCAYTPSFSNT